MLFRSSTGSFFQLVVNNVQSSVIFYEEIKSIWCFRMDNGSDNMIVMYLFETNSLLEKLDGILINSEISKEFTEEDINEIFRIMHTIKGSSAMMEFDSLMKISHKIEDLFFYIRENGMDKFDKGALFDLMFKSNDFLKAEVQKIENGEPLEEDIEIGRAHV